MVGSVEGDSSVCVVRISVGSGLVGSTGPTENGKQKFELKIN